MTPRKQKVILISRWGGNANFVAAKLWLQVQTYIHGKGDCGCTHKMKQFKVYVQITNVKICVMIYIMKR